MISYGKSIWKRMYIQIQCLTSKALFLKSLTEQQLHKNEETSQIGETWHLVSEDSPQEIQMQPLNWKWNTAPGQHEAAGLDTNQASAAREKRGFLRNERVWILVKKNHQVYWKIQKWMSNKHIEIRQFLKWEWGNYLILDNSKFMQGREMQCHIPSDLKSCEQ